MSLARDIEHIYDQPFEDVDRHHALQLFNEFKFFLNRGEVRAAERTGGEWHVNPWVKKGILVGFRLGVLADVSINAQFRYFDKNTFPLRHLTLDDGVRVVPGGSAIRDGAYVARGVVCMPPSYVNVGAYVEEGTLIDSHVLVGSCAQVGKRVHIGAGTQIGGVLEPVGTLPVIVEDDVFIGGNCGIFDGAIIGAGAVLGAGVVLTGSTAVYDAVRESVYRQEDGRPLAVPPGAVVVPGSRPIETAWAKSLGLSHAAPVIVKYRDSGTNASASMESALR